MNLLICDDEKEELNTLLDILKKCHTKNILTISTHTNPHSALEEICKNPKIFDACILDILMPGLSGIDLAKSLRNGGYEGKIIFLTTVNSFASESYTVHTFDYLLKPTTIEIMQDMLDKIEKENAKTDCARFLLQNSRTNRLLLFRDLEAVEVKGHNLIFHMVKGDPITIYATLESYLHTLLGDSRMIRIQRSYLVNMDYVVSFTPKQVTLQGGLIINISKKYGNFENKYLFHLYGRKE